MKGTTHPGEFSVVQFFADDTWEYVARNVAAEEAVRSAKVHCDAPGALLAVVQRVIITDGGDYTAFEWVHGRGVVFPPPPKPPAEAAR